MKTINSIKATLSGIGASLFSILGICCGTGACAAGCGLACAAPIASIFGISTAGLSAFSSKMLPVLIALSAIAFTYAYFSIYKSNKDECCDDQCCPEPASKQNRLIKPMFWLGLLMTIGFYTKTIYSSSIDMSEETSCCVSSSSCDSAKTTKNCKPSDCLTNSNKKDESN